DQYPVFNDYLSARGPSPLESVERPSGTPTLWCVIFKAMGMHTTKFFSRIGKYIPELKQPFCKFFSSVGNDE
ncbi:hypothetical protein, partial [Bacteroides uniformis]|uniref:hypothetical protein n=1 Tax=Bacteroides uniformis TaxID=820 RepID=UPI001AA1AD2C